MSKMMNEFFEDMDYIDMTNDYGEVEDFDYNKCYMEWKYPGILEEMNFVDKMNDYELVD